jgi:hypothetical protein
MVHTAGYPYEFDAQPWDSILSTVKELSQTQPSLDYLVAIALSVIESGASAQIAGALWMMDLAVAELPVQTAPIDLIVVRGPSSLDRAPVGLVRIEHLTVSGHNDVIDRPYADAVPLFWRFVSEKFGVMKPATAEPSK